MGNKKEIIYKICMALAIALFVTALYLNNEATIESMVDAKMERAAADVQNTDAQYASEQNADAENADMQNVDADNTGAQNHDKAFNFILYDEGGAAKEFSDYRGDIVFLVFWTPDSSESISQIATMKEALQITDSSTPDISGATGAPDTPGAPGISLVSVWVPDELVVTGMAVDGGLIDSHGGETDLSADTEDNSGAGNVSEFIDAGAELSKLFLVSDYPTTYVFYPNGELCDYQKGYIGAPRIERLAAQAAGGV